MRQPNYSIMKVFKNLFFISLLIFTLSCQDEEEINPVNNGNINDVAGTWSYLGEYTADGNLINGIEGSESNICSSNDYILLQNDENAILTYHFLENEIDGDCISQTLAFQYNYINSSTIQFLNVPSPCGNATVTISNNQMKIPICNGDTESFETDYALYQKQ